jgi:hypothetical protein
MPIKAVVRIMEGIARTHIKIAPEYSLRSIKFGWMALAYVSGWTLAAQGVNFPPLAATQVLSCCAIDMYW